MSISTRSQTVVIVLILSLAWAVGASAQGTTGGLAGVVTDSSGGVRPGVTVTLSEPNLPGVRTATTDSQGLYLYWHVR